LYPKKLHHFSYKYGLNRRNLEENFLQVASEMNNIKDYSLARKTVRRVDFRPRALHEFYTNKSTTNPSTTVLNLMAQTTLIPGSVIKIECSEYGEFMILWSLEVSCGDFSLLTFNPAVNGQKVGQGSYAVELPYKYERETVLSVYVEDENDIKLVDDMDGSGSSTPTNSGLVENPLATVQAYDHADPYRCLPERVSGQCQISLDQGTSYFGIQVGIALQSDADLRGAGVNALISKCIVVANRVVR